ncbi:unnamed protein product [Nippostrongylus brasiliensis]|uniref:Exocyst complex component 7 n=1 Tax=Nippostrongylus brasiliensis TaxID=27835 RepID=A0A0N4YH89_NIPBR|nr:unnamed protein product [Nippostrongylus brasiliensis]
MECLHQAIQFFESHPNYQNQTENMKITLETGFSVLETEYRSIVQKNTVQADPIVVIESLDDQYELIGSRAKNIRTARDLTLMTGLGVWLLDRERTRFLTHYAKIRYGCSKDVLPSKMFFLVNNFSVLKKATGRSEKFDRRGGDADGGECEGASLMAGCLLALLEVEEGVMVKTIPDTSRRAQVFRELVANPLNFVIRHIQRVVQDSDKGVLPLLPLLRFLSAHQARLQNLSTNSMTDVPFEALMRLLRVKSSSYITEFVEKLKSDNSKFVPVDGNVHPITVNTVNFLANLTAHRHTVTQQLLLMTAPQGTNSALLLPKLFARILSALGVTLKKKSENYDDSALSSLFLLNNYNYIAKALEDDEDGLLPVINEQNTQILSFYHSEIEQYINSYMRRYVRAFTREFDMAITQQRNYCIADSKLRTDISDHVKRALIPSYTSLVEHMRNYEQHSYRLLKYSPESLEATIDRLFDASG